MNQPLIVRGAPQEYECHEGAWQQLSAHLERRQLKKVLVLHGKKSWQAVQNFFPDLTDFSVHYEYYGGECTDAHAQVFVDMIKKEHFEVVVAIGGGKVLDTGKLASIRAQVPVFCLPTLAATCAAYAALSVVYNEDGSMDRYDIFPVSNALVLIEPRVILESPIELMVAGIGDTLAKWYEGISIIEQIEEKPIEISVAEFAAKQCQVVLLRDSQAALAAMEKNELNQAFLNVVETNILLAGMVGGFGDEYGRTAGAHSIHDALTILPQSHQQLHGNKVAYGVLVQLVMEDKWQELEELLPFYEELHLPKSLAAMEMTLTAEEITAVAERSVLPDETIHMMRGTITAEKVATAMEKLEDYMADKKVP
ncbi:iron-containing alcohol dehydrogenase family protein [Enterococcus sp. LJL120]